jgi:hypothetical protein
MEDFASKHPSARFLLKRIIVPQLFRETIMQPSRARRVCSMLFSACPVYLRGGLSNLGGEVNLSPFFLATPHMIFAGVNAISLV